MAHGKHQNGAGDYGCNCDCHDQADVCLKSKEGIDSHADRLAVGGCQDPRKDNLDPREHKAEEGCNCDPGCDLWQKKCPDKAWS